jgi:hypothetical protein
MSVVISALLALGVGTLGSALACRRSSRLSEEARIIYPMLGGALALGAYALFIVVTH